MYTSIHGAQVASMHRRPYTQATRIYTHLGDHSLLYRDTHAANMRVHLGTLAHTQHENTRASVPYQMSPYMQATHTYTHLVEHKLLRSFTHDTHMHAHLGAYAHNCPPHATIDTHR